MNQEILSALKIVAVTFLCSALIMPGMKKIAFHIGALDIPRSDEGNRHIHKRVMPKLGGVGIFLAFLVGYMLFHHQQCFLVWFVHFVNSILIGSFIIILTGIIDDIKSIRASRKLLGQLIAACIIVFYGGILLNNITAFGYTIDFGILSYPLTIFFIVACTNIINLIDGLDGLSSGITLISCLSLMIIFSLNNSPIIAIILTTALAGAIVGFLPYNFNPAKIFMGDSGSMFLGYIIAVIALLGFKNVTLTSFIIPILLLAIPILDTLFAILRRLINHKPLGEPDKNHLHHQLLKLKLSQKKTVIIIYIVDLLFASASIVYAVGNSMLGSNIYGMVIYAILFVLILLLILKTNIIWNHDKKKEKAKEETKEK